MNAGRVIVGLVAIAAAGYLLYLLGPVLTPFIVSALFAYVGNPLVTRAQRYRVPRSVTIVLLFALVVLVVLGLMLWLIPLVQRQIVTFVNNVPAYLEWLQARIAALDLGHQADLASLKEEVVQQWQNIGKWLAKALSYVTGSGGRLIGWLVNIFLIPVVTFYLLRDWDEVLHGVQQMLPPHFRARATLFARDVDDALGGFLRGQLTVMLALAIIYSVGLWIVGLDLALLIGLVSGLVSFVPYLGFFVGIVAAMLAALVQFQDTIHVLYVVIVYLVGQALEGSVLTPRLVGERIGLHPVVVIFAVLAGGQLFGFLGVLLALPGAAVFNVWWRHVQHAYYQTGS